MRFCPFLILPFVVMIQALTQEHVARLKKWHMECFNETDADPDEILKLKAGNCWLESKVLKTWVLCVLNKQDLMSMEGVFRLDTALSIVPPRDRVMIEDYIDDCLPKTAMEYPYEIAWAYSKCYHLQAKHPKNKGKRLHYLTLFY